MIKKPRTASTAAHPYPTAIDELGPDSGVAYEIIAERRRRGTGRPR